MLTVWFEYISSQNGMPEHWKCNSDLIDYPQRVQMNRIMCPPPERKNVNSYLSHSLSLHGNLHIIAESGIEDILYNVTVCSPENPPGKKVEEGIRTPKYRLALCTMRTNFFVL